MATVASTIGRGLVTEAINRLVADVTAAVPKVFAGLLFLLIAAVLVKIIMAIVNRVLSKTLVGESPVYRQFITAIVGALLWFAVALSFLGVVGLESVAAALGTASGFLALGGLLCAFSNFEAEPAASTSESFRPVGSTTRVGRGGQRGTEIRGPCERAKPARRSRHRVW